MTLEELNRVEDPGYTPVPMCTTNNDTTPIPFNEISMN
jgi:hypothetical protein